jgi:hypothetical protein
MEFLCVLKLESQYANLANWTDATRKVQNDHWNYLVQLHNEGKVKFVARTNYPISHESNRGYAIYTAGSESEAHDMLLNDPCIANGVMQGELHPLLLFMLGDKLFE